MQPYGEAFCQVQPYGEAFCQVQPYGEVVKGVGVGG